MKPITAFLLTTAGFLTVAAVEDPPPALAAASERVNAAWGATTAEGCRTAIEEGFAAGTELYLSTEDFAGVLPRSAMLAMAEQLGDGGLERSWTTDEESWLLGERMAVRKARERLREQGGERTVLTTNVFEKRGDRWLLVHAHHSEVAPEDGR